MAARFASRAAAGRELALAVQALDLAPPVRVLALPRGGVPVAAWVASALAVPLDLLLVRKIGAPRQPELAVAAIAEGDPPVLVIDDDIARLTGADRAYIDAQARLGQLEIARRRSAYRPGAGAPEVAGHTVVVVDDGIATGATVRAALRALRRRGAARLVLAVPVAPADTLAALRAEVDAIVCLEQPLPFVAVGRHYADFTQVSDDEVRTALASSAPR